MASTQSRYRCGESLPESHARAQRARSLRRELLPPERLLWRKLRNRQLAGLKFRRQYPHGNYTLDFYYEQIKLAIEIDGRSHEARQNTDAKRDAFMSREGIQTLRIPASLVLRDMDAVLRTIGAESRRLLAEQDEMKNSSAACVSGPHRESDVSDIGGL